MVQTAVDGIGAAAAAPRCATADDSLQEVARAGEPEAFLRALHAAEAAVIDAGQVAEIQVGGASALAAPLGANEDGDQVIGIVSVARGDRAFTHGERELFAYLTNQASVSVENVDLHETVQRQAVTDELTGLFNHRRFQEVMSIEVERARRYGHEIGLIMLDIDNFKQVNDSTATCRATWCCASRARAAPCSARSTNPPATAARSSPSRSRRPTSRAPTSSPSGCGGQIEALRCRCSTATAAPGHGVVRRGLAGHRRRPDKERSIAAADAALYEAKRTGKNRTVRARLTRRRGVHGVASTE